MNKLQMAHEYAMKHGRNNSWMESDVIDAWKYADAMQAEADKREKEESEKKRADIREMLKANNTFVEREGQHFDDVEWQPDWSQAPDWANWWAVDGFDRAYWFEDSPKLNIIDDTWDNHYRDKMAGDYGYTGDWRNSLRKRPQ